MSFSLSAKFCILALIGIATKIASGMPMMKGPFGGNPEADVGAQWESEEEECPCHHFRLASYLELDTRYGWDDFAQAENGERGGSYGPLFYFDDVERENPIGQFQEQFIKTNNVTFDQCFGQIATTLQVDMTKDRHYHGDSYGDSYEDMNQQGELTVQTTCATPRNAVTGGTGPYACARGWSRILFGATPSDPNTVEYCICTGCEW